MKALSSCMHRGESMAQLTIRGVDEALVRALKVRAARAGRSVEAELRLILEQVLGGPECSSSTLPL